VFVPGFLRPRDTLSDGEVQSGLKWLTREGTASMGYEAITSGGFMAAFAIALGANNTQIGILASLPFLTQPLRIPAVILIERIRNRKLISLLAAIFAQSIWIPIALIPLLIDSPSSVAVFALMAGVAIRSLITPFWSSAWMGWMKDLVPAEIRGRYFARRLAWASAVGMILGLGGAVFVDYWTGRDLDPADAALGYTYVLLVGALLLGISVPFFISKMPEPKMQVDLFDRRSMLASLSEPVKDSNFRQLLIFQSSWALVMNLAIPFFAVYMIKVLGLSVTVVMLLTAVSQISNILFLRVWGGMVDRLGNKVIIRVSSSLYLLVLLGWTFTSMPDRHALTIPMLVAFHILAGIASAGLNVANGTVAMKLARSGHETAYLAAASLAVNFGAGVGPLIGGQFADYFNSRSFKVSLDFISSGEVTGFSPFYLTGFDFLFAIAFVLGVIVLGQLRTVREEGEVDQRQVIDELLAPWRGLSRPMSSVPGFGLISQYPLTYLTRAPIPGFDVAIGVTAYQIADAAGVATRATLRSRTVATRLRVDIAHTVHQMLVATEHAGEHAGEVSRYTVRGAIHAAADASAEMIHVIEAAGYGVMRAVDHLGSDPAAALYGFGYGVAQAASEGDIDPELASEMMNEVAEGMVQSIDDIDAAEARDYIENGMIAAREELEFDSEPGPGSGENG